MLTKENSFKVDYLDFSTFDAYEREYFTIEYKDPEDDPVFGKSYFCVEGLTDKFIARIWVKGEKIWEVDEETNEIVVTNKEKDSYFLDYTFSPAELDAIKWRLIQYLHCLCYYGKDYAISEMSVPIGQEAWRKAKGVA